MNHSTASPGTAMAQALYEIAFAPEMLPHRIEKERKVRCNVLGQDFGYEEMAMGQAVDHQVYGL